MPVIREIVIANSSGNCRFGFQGAGLWDAGAPDECLKVSRFAVFILPGLDWFGRLGGCVMRLCGCLWWWWWGGREGEAKRSGTHGLRGRGVHERGDSAGLFGSVHLCFFLFFLKIYIVLFIHSCLCAAALQAPGSIAGLGTSIACPGSSIAGLDRSIARQRSSIAGPGSSIAGRGSSIAGRGSSIAGPRSSIAGPGSSNIAGPGSSIAGRSSSIAGRSSSIAGPGSSIVWAGSSIAGPRISIAGPGSSITGPGGSIAWHCRTRQQRCRCIAGALQQRTCEGVRARTGTSS